VQECVGTLGGEASGDRHQSRGGHRREQRRRANGARREQALDDRRAHRVPDQDRRRRQLRDDVLDVGRVVVETGDVERLAAARFAVAAQRQRVRRIALPREPREEVHVPAPGVAVAAVDEEQRRLAAVAAWGQPRAKFEMDLERQHRDGSRECVSAETGTSGAAWA
jgi:hypothetical protein